MPSRPRCARKLILEQIREQLLAVVSETMQPAHASLWLRSPERRSEDLPHPLHETSSPLTLPAPVWYPLAGQLAAE